MRRAILLSLFGTLLFTLQVEPAHYFFPWHTAGMAVLQVGAFLFVLAAVPLSFGRLPLLFLGLWGALFCWALISVFWSAAPQITLQQLPPVYLTPGLILILVYGDENPTATFWGFARGMTWAGAFLAAVGLLLYLGGETVVLDQWEGLQLVQLGPLRLAQSVHFLGGWARISSLTGDPNTLALWLALSLPCTGLLYLSRRLSPPGFLCLGMVQTFALMLTFSRAGAGMALLALALVFLFLGRGAGGKYARAAALAVALLAALLSVNEYFLFYPDGGGPLVLLDSSLGLRDGAWHLARRVFSRFPFSGAGFATTGVLLREAGLNLLHLHNLYLSILCESGLFGLALFLFFWFAAMVLAAGKWIRLKTHGRRFWGGSAAGAGETIPGGKAGGRSSVDTVTALAGVMALLLSLLLHQFFETMILRTNFHTLLWLYLVGTASHPRLD